MKITKRCFDPKKPEFFNYQIEIGKFLFNFYSIDWKDSYHKQFFCFNYEYGDHHWAGFILRFSFPFIEIAFATFDPDDEGFSWPKD